MAKRRHVTHQADFWGYGRSFLHDYMPKERKLSNESVEAYRISLECLVGYLENEQGIPRRDVTFDRFEYKCLKGWLKWMIEDKKYSPKTVDLRLTSVRSFLRYCAAEDVSLMDLHNGACLLKGPKKQKKPIDYMSDAAMAAILAAFNGATAKSRRNRAMMILLYDSGVRVSELVDACVCDMSFSKPARITVTGKGRKTRTVPLMDKTVDHMKVYLDEFHPGWQRNPTTTPLFYCRRNGIAVKLSTDTVSSTLKKAASAASASCADVPKRVHCHMVRKTRAMDLYRQGVPLPIIMKLLGHESMSTTSGFYAFATDEMMFDAMASASSTVITEQPVLWRQKEKLDALYSLR